MTNCLNLGPPAGNTFRKSDGLRKLQYAQMPQGTYAPSAGGGGAQFPGPPAAASQSAPSMFNPPPVAQVRQILFFLEIIFFLNTIGQLLNFSYF